MQHIPVTSVPASPAQGGTPAPYTTRYVGQVLVAATPQIYDDLSPAAPWPRLNNRMICVLGSAPLPRSPTVHTRRSAWVPSS
jgi:hypothetical protein